MCERPGGYLGLRRGDAAALAVAALALVLAPGDAGGQELGRRSQCDRSPASTDSLVYQRLSGQGVLRRGAPRSA